METQLLIINELGFIIDQPFYKEILGQIEKESKMINSFSKMFKK
nr:hypothetical protein [Flavobacterium flabelliforme]